MVYKDNTSVSPHHFYVKHKRFYTAYPELKPDDIRLSWNKKAMRQLEFEGYKYCRKCKIMVRIEERTCRVCRKKFSKIPNAIPKKESTARLVYVSLQRSNYVGIGSSLLW